MESDKLPLVSVYIPTKNRRKLLERAIESVLNQTYRKVELIVVNDGSTDDTQKYLEGLTGKNNIKVIHNETSKGANCSRNMAINCANGTYVTGLDDDDYFDLERIEMFVRAYDDNYSFLCANQKYVRGNRFVIKSSFDGEITLDHLLAFNVVGNQVFTIKQHYLDVGGFDESLSACQDYDLWVRMVKKLGNAFKIKNATYIVDEEATANRITTSSKAFSSYLQVYHSQKHFMNSFQRGSRLLAIRELQGKRLSRFNIIKFLRILGLKNILAHFYRMSK